MVPDLDTNFIQACSVIQKFKESGHFPVIMSECRSCYVLQMREIFRISYIGHILWGKHRRYSTVAVRSAEYQTFAQWYSFIVCQRYSYNRQQDPIICSPGDVENNPSHSSTLRLGHNKRVHNCTCDAEGGVGWDIKYTLRYFSLWPQFCIEWGDSGGRKWEKNYEHIHYNNTTNTRWPHKHATNSHILSPPTPPTSVSPPSPFHLKQSINPYQNTRRLYASSSSLQHVPKFGSQKCWVGILQTNWSFSRDDKGMCVFVSH